MKPFPSALASGARATIVYAFTIAVVAQSLHMVEHVAQVYQHAILGWSIAESHGILFFLDLEWNHWIFNALYFALLGTVFFDCRFYRSAGTVRERPLAFMLFNLGFVVQGYHVIEHSVRILQFFQTSCTPCPGILGQFFDGVYLHATLNTLVYITPLVAFVAYGFHSRLRQLASSRFPARL